MKIIRDKQLIERMVRDEPGHDKESIKFILDRYFYHTINMLKHGYPVHNFWLFKFKLGIIFYSMIPAKYRDEFRYSNKLFGYVLLPVYDNTGFYKTPHNFKPGKKILDELAEIADSDLIYTLTEE